MSNGNGFRDYRTLGRRVRLRGRLELQTALRVGTGRPDELSGADIGVVMDADRLPYIPGSSFKGALRAHVERLVRSLCPSDQDVRSWACNPLVEAERCIPGQRTAQVPDEVPTIQDLRRRAVEAARQGAGVEEDLLANLIGKHSCYVCRLFGSPWLASRVQIKDLELTWPEFWLERRYQVRTGVGIERDSDTAQEGVLYSTQAVPPGVEFNWEIAVENADPETEEPLLWLGLREMMNEMVGLGGARSRGLGRVKLHLDGPAEVVDGTDRMALLAYLTKGKAGEEDWATLEGRIEGCLWALTKPQEETEG